MGPHKSNMALTMFNMHNSLFPSEAGFGGFQEFRRMDRLMEQMDRQRAEFLQDMDTEPAAPEQGKPFAQSYSFSSFTSNTNGEVVTTAARTSSPRRERSCPGRAGPSGRARLPRPLRRPRRARSRHALFTTWKSRISKPSTSSMPPGCIGSHSMHWSLVPSSPSMPCMLPWSRTSTAWLDLSKQQQGSYYMQTRSTILCHHGLATAGLTPLCAVKFSTLYCTQMCWFLVCPSAKATGQVRQHGLIHKKKDASARAPGRRTARRNPLHGRVLHGYAWLHVNYMAISK